MAAVTEERRSLGVKNLLRKLRGTAPRPVTPEDSLESLFSSNPLEEGEPREAAAEQTAPTAKAPGGNPLSGANRVKGPNKPF